MPSLEDLANAISKTQRKKKVPPQVVKDAVPRIVIPENLGYRQAAQYCEAKADEMEAITTFSRTYGTLPWAGAYAVEKLLMREYSATAPDAEELSVPSNGGNRKVKWGVWKIAGFGKLSMGFSRGETGAEFTIALRARRMQEHDATKLLDQIGAEIALRELYAGSALVLNPNSDGDLDIFEPPKVINLPNITPEDIVLPASLDASVRAEVFGPITDSKELRKRGIPLRRGILCVGRPGTGKTMTARIASKLAVDRNWAVFYLADARAVESALKIAAAFQPALLVCEDIDRSMSGQRDAFVDRVLNALDGLDKSAEVLFVATTNDDSKLPAPLLRPGRLDSFLTFEAPDAKAGLRLVRMYLGDNGGLFDAMDDEQRTALGSKVNGLLPASLQEVASRSILHAVQDKLEEPDFQCLMHAADTVRLQQQKLEAAERPKDQTPELRVLHARDADSDRGKIPNDLMLTASVTTAGAVTSEEAQRAALN